MHARPGRLAHHLVEPVVAHRHHQQRLRPPLGRDDQPAQRAEVVGEALAGEQGLELEARLARRGLGVRPEQLLEAVALVDESEREASGQWPSLGLSLQSSTQPEAREVRPPARPQAVRGSASAAALAAAARAFSWAARGGGVCWFASFSTRTAPIARARPSVSRRSARSTPFGAPGDHRELVEAGEQPAEAELVAQRQRGDADDAAVLRFARPARGSAGP